MSLAVVAIIGRPNVGKSSLFNALARRRTSIVDPTPGVTRDRVSTICDIDDTYFELVDTGGYGIVDRDDLSEDVERQIKIAVVSAHLILFVVDAREGLMALDRATADLLRKNNQADRVVLLANKVDDPRGEVDLSDFVRLGFGPGLAVSAIHGHGRTELHALIKQRVGALGDEVPPDPVMKIALVGKRNAGKSTFINSLAGEERVIVSEIPGTTRDSIDVRFEKDDRTIVAIDTAGVRKKRKMADDVEFYAYTRALRSIRRADVVLFLIDAALPVGQVDKRLCQVIASEFKPCVIVVNKWDVAKGRTSTEEYGEYLTKVLPEIDYAPVAFTSAVEGKNVSTAIDLATELFKQSQTRVGTGKLNQALQQALSANQPSAKRGTKAPKFFYVSQVSTQPPTLVFFVNGAELVTQNYERFLMNRFREMLPFDEIPIRFVFRSRRQRDRETGVYA